MSASDFNGIKVSCLKPEKRGRKPTIIIPLPRECWRPIEGGCRCPACVTEDDKPGPAWWDAVATSPGTAHTWTVHAPYLQPGGMYPAMARYLATRERVS
jgi:hypothetical protein